MIEVTSLFKHLLWGVGGNGFRSLISDCIIDVYTSPRPSSANDAPTGTRLLTISRGAASPTLANPNTFTLTMSGSSGQFPRIITETGGGSAAVVWNDSYATSSAPFNTSLALTAIDVARRVNSNTHGLLYAHAQNNVVTVCCAPWFRLNARALNGSSTVININPSTATGNCAYAEASSLLRTTLVPVNGVNCLRWLAPEPSGAIRKRPEEEWSGVSVASGTAAWFRLRANANATGNGSGNTEIRLDGDVSGIGGGGEIRMNSTAVTAGKTLYVTSASIVPVFS